MEASESEPRRSVRRTFSNSSAPPQLTSRRDSLFAAAGDEDDNDNDLLDDQDMVALMSTANLYAATSPRRRFARRNGLCQFQLLRDAVQTNIDMNGLDLSGRIGGDSSGNASGEPSPTRAACGQANEAQATDFGRRRKAMLPRIHENPQTPSRLSGDTDGHACSYFAVAAAEGQSRKLSRTCFRPNPSTDTLYTDESSL